MSARKMQSKGKEKKSTSVGNKIVMGEMEVQAGVADNLDGDTEVVIVPEVENRCIVCGTRANVIEMSSGTDLYLCSTHAMFGFDGILAVLANRLLKHVAAVFPSD